MGFRRSVLDRVSSVGSPEILPWPAEDMSEPGNGICPYNSIFLGSTGPWIAVRVFGNNETCHEEDGA